MRCPFCAIEMDEHTRHGVKVDHCPDCGGVWLDPGELDHLIAAVRPAVTLPDPEPARPVPSAKPPPPPHSDTPHFDTPRAKRDAQHAAPKPTPKPERFEDRRRATSRKPGQSHRYSRRYSNAERLRDVLDEIFDFD